MNSVWYRVFSIFLALPLWSVGAKAADPHVCIGVYEDATRNYLFDERDRSALFVLYDHFCSATGNLKSSNNSLALEAVVYSIPVKFGGSSGSTQKRMQNFCRNYQQVRFTSDSSLVKRSDVVVDALRSFNDCVEIANRGVRIRHSIPGPGSLAINFDFDRNTTFLVQGVSLGPNMHCASNSLFPDHTTHELTEKTGELKATNSFSVTCSRAAEKIDGQDVYPLSWVGVASNWGTYTVKLPAETVLGGVFASQVTAQLDTLQQTTVAALAKANALEDALKSLKANIRVRVLKFYRGEYNESGDYGPRFDPRDYRDPQQIAKKLCGNGAIANATQYRSHPGNCCGYDFWNVTCVNF